MADGPIFIGGLDRSGKTLMRLSLSSHPRISMTRRTYTWTEVYNRYGDLRRPQNFERCLAALLHRKQIAALQLDSERIRREFWQGEPTYGRLFGMIHQHYAERAGKPRWGDQLALVEHYADPVFRAYPDARIIHMIRDPRERFAAAYGTRRSAGKAGAATARWLVSAELARRNLQRYQGRYAVVCLEALLARREATLRAVCAFVGEEFAPAMLTLQGAMRFGSEDEASDLASESPHGQLSQREIAFVQAYVGRELAAHGYQQYPVRLSLADRLLLYCVDWPINAARATACWIRDDLALRRHTQ